MKKGILMLGMLFMFLFGNSQIDSQWYIKDGQNNGNQSTIVDTFKIEGVGIPDTSCHPLANNDLFIIYNDNSYYNSRYHSDNSKYKDPKYYSGSQNNILNLLTEKSIKHLYFTNKYEGDDPPLLVKVKNGNSKTPIELSHTYPQDTLSTNHSIKPGRDITLILKPFQESFDLKLKIIRINQQNGLDTVSESIGKYFDLSLFPNTSKSYIGDTEPIFDGPTNNNLKVYSNTRFINLRAKTLAEGGFNTAMDKKAIFIGKGVLQTEVIADVHDPNYVSLLSICGNEYNANQTYYTFKIEILNDGDEIAKDVSLNIELPFDFKSVALSSYLMGDYKSKRNPTNVINPNRDERLPSPKVNYYKNSKSISFFFPDANLCNCLVQDRKNLAKGYVVFTVIRENAPRNESISDVKFNTASSILKSENDPIGKQFNITEFKVKTKYKGNKKEISVNCNDKYKINRKWIKPCNFYRQYMRCECNCDDRYNLFKSKRFENKFIKSN